MTIPTNLNHYPVVVFIHGSGPNDRDETLGPNKPFQNLAHGLASFGIASLRYDKRTFIYGSKSTLHEEEIDLNNEVLIDAGSAIRLAQNYKQINNVYVLGHSLGAMMAPKIANENKEVEGIILMAGNARPLEELIIDQYTYLYAMDGMSEREKKSLDKIEEKIRNLEKLKMDPFNKSRDLPLGLPASYWLSLLNYDQIKEIQKVKTRILILQGERDYQVTMKDFALWQTALMNSENATFHSYPKLNHLFLEGEGLSYPSEYKIEGEIPDYVIRDIANWILDLK